MKTLYGIIVFSLVALSGRLAGQDPHFSQFFANRVYLNPAYAGFDPGTTVTLNYRDQWIGIPDGSLAASPTSYRTLNATVERQTPCFLQVDGLNLGFALSAFADDAGQAPLRTQGAGVAMSFEFPSGNLGRRLQRLDWRVGYQLSFMQKHLDGDFVYSSQLDPVVGLLGDPSALNLRSGVFPNFNAGVMVRGFWKRSKYRNTLFTAGLSWSNLNEPNQSLHDAATEARLPRRTTFHLGTTHLITTFRGVAAPLYIVPQFRWDRQVRGKLNVHTVGAYALSKAYYTGLFLQYNFPNAARQGVRPAEAWLGRGTTTIILNAGIDLRSVSDWYVPWRKRRDGMVLGLTYDLNLTGLTSETTLGALEVSLRFNFARERRRGCSEIGRFELYGGKCPVRF